MGNPKLAGILIQRREVQGAAANLNVNTDANPEQLAAFRKALWRARLDDDW